MRGLFRRSRTGVRLSRHSTVPGIRLGRYESGLDAVWAWQEHTHLLVIEPCNYGVGENLVRRVARKHDGERVQLDPKGYLFSNRQPWMFMTRESCLLQLGVLKAQVRDRIDAAEAGEDVEHLLVTIPELHDIVDFGRPDEFSAQFLIDLAFLLKVGHAARIHVLANIRQPDFFMLPVPAEILSQFSGLLVLDETTKPVTQQLALPEVFDRPHGRLGDLEGGFWPLEVRTR